ncbi:hypothetical protein [Petropleomorpha daqingensis]|uniref:Uncharacterized protein n=1 Tax=Petropleomorpha daqingensis TaxID=2026353 RepID=A0A853CNF8_9ACTN|nr:hypothetical protein [Petropleomorpha daqingensis]NYJ08042.1 hypothetical protein [Petropleomorpha daqingensis]
MTDPEESTAGARRTGTVACEVGAVALLAAAVVFWAGGRPYGVNIGGGGLYLLGLLAGLIGTVLLWMSSSRRAVTGVALLLLCACPVITISDIADGAAQLVLMAIAAVVLAAAALLARRG